MNRRPEEEEEEEEESDGRLDGRVCVLLYYSMWEREREKEGERRLICGYKKCMHTSLRI